MIARIVANTPVWVWPLFLALLWLGFQQTRQRQVPLPRLLILPLVMTGLSILGIASNFGFRLIALFAWGVTICLSAWLVFQRSIPPSTRFDSASGVFSVPGSWIPLALILGIFTVKYAVGVALAMQPSLAADDIFGAVVSASYGVCSGIFVGRAGRLWKLRTS